MASSKSNALRPRRVMVVGFDGATLDLIHPWAEAGILPTFHRLMVDGAWGPLQSTMPPVTPAAWSSLATGMNQGKHGLFDFFGRHEGSYETYVVNATHRHGASLWRLLSQAGHGVIVSNVPATYPPEQVNGLMVSGLLTPTQATDAAWPVGLLDDLRQAVPDFSFYPPSIFSKGQEVEFVNDVLAWDKMTLQATEFLMERLLWDFIFTVFNGIDIVSHFMWEDMITDGASAPLNDTTVRESLANAIQNVYRQADAILGRLLETAGNDIYMVIVSDHGFGPLDYYMHLNAWLVQQGYLKFKRTPAALLKYLAYRLGITPLCVLELLRALRLGGRVQQVASGHNVWLKSLVKGAFLSLADVDWSRTTAYAAGYGGSIFVNLKGREAQGIVEPGAEYEALIEQVTADLRALRHPDTGEPCVSEIYHPKDLYSGPYTDRAPDLLFLPRDWRNQAYGVHDFASNRWLERSPDRTGTHRMNGILFLYGPGIRSNCPLQEASIMDVAPTVLALMGVPIPDTMDGQVLLAAMSDELREELTITYTDEAEGPQEPRPTSELSAEEEEELRKRLRGLGYVA